MDEEVDDESLSERRGHDHGLETESWLKLQIKRIVTAPRKKESALRSMKQCSRRGQNTQVQLLDWMKEKKERKTEKDNI